ncbi:MAG: metallophosphoesterase family protein, partial [Thermoprotei archaeon]
EYRGFTDITWLADESKRITVDGVRLTLVGSKGVRDRVTPWLVWGVTPNPDVEGTILDYERRTATLEHLLADNSDTRLIVFSHFAPTYRTLLGEDPSQYAELGTTRFEHLIEKYRPALWLHGHAHKSKRTEARVGGTLVCNVALPATHRVTIINLE